MKYEDILYLKRPESNHIPMSNNSRAKIFLPFAALKGYEELIEKQNIQTPSRIELSQDALEELDEKLMYILENLPIKISVTYYTNQKYQTIEDTCMKINIDRNEMKLQNHTISLQDILQIDI